MNVRPVFAASLLVIAIFTANAPAQADRAAAASISESSFGRMPDGQDVALYTLTNAHGLRAKVITYGAILVSLEVPDRDGKLADVVLGFDDLDSYIQRNPLFGAVVGRYANRIAGARFMLDGKEYRITANAGKNHIHGGGGKRFDKALWKGSPYQNDTEVGVRRRG